MNILPGISENMIRWLVAFSRNGTLRKNPVTRYWDGPFPYSPVPFDRVIERLEQSELIVQGRNSSFSLTDKGKEIVEAFVGRPGEIRMGDIHLKWSLAIINCGDILIDRSKPRWSSGKRYPTPPRPTTIAKLLRDGLIEELTPNVLTLAGSWKRRVAILGIKESDDSEIDIHLLWWIRKFAEAGPLRVIPEQIIPSKYKRCASRTINQKRLWKGQKTTIDAPKMVTIRKLQQLGIIEEASEKDGIQVFFLTDHGNLILENAIDAVRN